MYKTKSTLRLLALSLLAAASLYSCKGSDENEPVDITPRQLQLEVKAPIGLEGASLDGVSITLVNEATAQEISVPASSINGGHITLNLAPGRYKASLKATLHLIQQGEELATSPLEGEYSFVVSTEAQQPLSYTFLYRSSSRGFVIEELFISGTRLTTGGDYDDDQYFKITNNSDETLYADGLAIAQTSLQANEKIDLTPDKREEHVSIDMLYVVPGDGTQYPVKPGESIIICQSAINHKAINSNSFDLSKANFEWYTAAQAADQEVPNNPNVPDLINYYRDEEGNEVPASIHRSGAKSYVLARIPQGMTAQKYLAEYKDKYSYKMRTDEGEVFDQDTEGYKLPNEWIIDAVVCSWKNDYQWQPISAKLDAGWTWIAEASGDAGRYGKSMRRKSFVAGGIKRLVDTNNSTRDFEEPSLASLTSL